MAVKNINDFLEMVGNHSLPDELDENWEKWVCRPVIEQNMGPRHARALLEVAGIEMSKGIDIKKILMRMVKKRR